MAKKAWPFSQTFRFEGIPFLSDGIYWPRFCLDKKDPLPWKAWIPRRSVSNVLGPFGSQTRTVNPAGRGRYAVLGSRFLNEEGCFFACFFFVALNYANAWDVWSFLRHSQFCLWSYCGIECFYSECPPQSKAQKVPLKAEKSSKHWKDKKN